MSYLTLYTYIRTITVIIAYGTNIPKYSTTLKMYNLWMLNDKFDNVAIKVINNPEIRLSQILNTIPNFAVKKQVYTNDLNSVKPITWINVQLVCYSGKVPNNTNIV